MRSLVRCRSFGQSWRPKDDVSQFQYLEKLTGRELNIFRDYHAYPDSTSSAKDQPVNDAERYFAARAGTYVDINWIPASNWRSAMPATEGGDPSINANIDDVANQVKSLAPHKVFLSIWHEANLLVSGGTSCPIGAGVHVSYGTPAEFRAAYANVYNRFQTDGVSNVVWALSFSSYGPRTCVVPELWPGDKVVDWVIYDTYSKGKPWNQTAGEFYGLLEKDNSQAVNFESKPWGIGEYGTCGQDQGITGASYYQSVKAALDANTYPRLKMYLVYADTGNNSGTDCLTNQDGSGQPDSQKLAAFNMLANDPAFAK